MIVDTSVIATIMLDEPETARFLLAMRHQRRRMSVASFVEIGIVIDARGLADQIDPAVQIRRLGITLEPITVEQGKIARDAHRTFGRRSGHAARLNFGDCFTYALAMETGEPILCKGNDFALTDARIAAY